MQTIMLCTILPLLVVIKAYELPSITADTYCAFNGVFTNQKQASTEKSNRPLFTIIIQPIWAPRLSQLPVVYFEQSVGDRLVRAEILTITVLDQDTLYMDPFNFTGNVDTRPRWSKRQCVRRVLSDMRFAVYDTKPGKRDPNYIKALTPEQVQGQSDCRQMIRRIAPTVLFSSWPDCKLPPSHGNREDYEGSVTCDGLTVAAPADAAEKPTLVPYKFDRQGRRFDLENAPSNFYCACDRKPQ